MKRELTKEQVAQLFEFTRKHYVEYYDVQVELVDHLASSIETEMEQNPVFSFDEALNNVFGSFGIFGFDGIEVEKANSVRKQQTKLWQKTFLSLFKWPNLIKSLILFYIIHFLFSFLPIEGGSLFIGLFLALTSFFYLIKEGLYVRKNLKKKLVLINQRFQYIGVFYAPIYLYQLLGKWLTQQNVWWVSLIFTILILELIAYQITSKKVFKEARELYPEAFKDYVAG